MGSTVSTSSTPNNISRTDVSKSPNGDDQTVVYSTPNSDTCTIRATLGVETASVTLKDYTFDKEGTRVNIKVGRQIGTVDLTYGGKALDVRKDAGQFSIGYGVPWVRCGFLVASKHKDTHSSDALFVTHMYAEEKWCIMVVFKVWYDVGKGCFMCLLTGPSRHTSPLEAVVAMRKAYSHVSSGAGDSSTDGGNRTNITGLINNTGGPVYGTLNGSIVNFFNVYMNNK
ncbi:unnamed protein product [Lathyrus sativus]|nr:unnamed protein product [Lathyrus sativus]